MAVFAKVDLQLTSSKNDPLKMGKCLFTPPISEAILL